MSVRGVEGVQSGGCEVEQLAVGQAGTGRELGQLEDAQGGAESRELARDGAAAGVDVASVEDEELALAAYNWGPTRIDRRLSRGSALPKEYPRLVNQAYGASPLARPS